MSQQPFNSDSGFSTTGNITALGNLNLGNTGANSSLNMSGAGAGNVVGYQTMLSVVSDDGAPYAITVQNATAGLGKGLGVYVEDNGNIGLETLGNSSSFNFTTGPSPYNIWTLGPDGNLSAPGNISTTGNITAGYLVGNGVSITGVTATANTGNVTFNDQIVIGTGISNLVSGLYLSPSSSSANAVQYLRVRGDVTYEPTHIHFDTGNNQYFNQFIGDDNKYVLLSNTGNIVVNTDDYVGNAAQWTFGATGNLTLPSGGNLIVSGAIVGTHASPAPYLSGFDSVSALTLSASGNITGGNISTGTITLTNGAVIKDTATYAVAFGKDAGLTSQGQEAVAVGHYAGRTSQGNGGVAIGVLAGNSSQGQEAVAVGIGAGRTNQGVNSVAIGSDAGRTDQGNNSIIINATGSALNQTVANTFTVKPVRQANTANAMYYDASTGEITYDTAGGGGNTGNVTFDDQAVVGTGDQVGGSGLYLAPGTESVGNLQYIRVRGGDVATHIHLDTGNNAYFDQYFGDDIKYVKLAAGGNVQIGSNDDSGNSAQWTFGADGTLTFPAGNLVITPDNALFGNSAVIASEDHNLITLSTGANGGLSSLWVEDIGNVGTSNIAAVYANPTPGSKIVRIAVGQNGGGGPNLWDFDASGNATFPANGTTNLHDVVSVGLATFSNVQIGGNLNYEESANLIVVEDNDGFADIIAQNKNAGGNASMNIVLVNNDPGNVYMAMGVNSSTFTPLYNTLFEIPNAGYCSHSTTQVMGPQSSESGESRMFLTYSSGSYALELNDHGAIGWGASYNGNLTQGNFGNVGQVLTSAGANSPPTWNDTISVAGNVIAGNILVVGSISPSGVSSPAPSLSGFSSVSALTLSATGNVTVGGNLSVTGNIVTPTGLIYGVPASYTSATGPAMTTYVSGPTGATSPLTVIFNNITNSFGSDIALDTATGNITLQPGKTYQLSGAVTSVNLVGAGTPTYQWYNLTASQGFGVSGEIGGYVAVATFTPSVTSNICLRATAPGNSWVNIYQISGQYFNINVIGGQALITGVSTTGNITGGNILTTGQVSASGNVTVGGNLSVTGNIIGNGAGLTGVAKQTVGLWTVTPGTATYSFTVPAGTYAMWVSGNIPNGIIVWNATATITNTNVPVVGQQYAWVYNGGGTPIDFVSIPNQFVGTGNAIVRSNVAPSSTTNRFDFSINNTSGGNANVSYGYTAL